MGDRNDRRTDAWTSEAELEALGGAATGEVTTALQQCASSAQLIADRARGRLDAEVDEHLAFLVKGTKRLQRMAEAFATYARNLSRPVRRARVPLNDVVDTALASRADKLAAVGGTIERADLPAVLGDARLIGLLVGELLDNALAQAGERPPRIRVEVREGRVRVSDNGPGIDPAASKRAIAPFSTLGSGQDGEHVGLGLYLCQRIVACHGGRLRIDPGDGGEGTCVSFDLPPAPLARPARAPKAETDGGGKKILAAEDDDAVRHALSVILRRSGYVVVPARDGREAVRLWQEERPDLVIMDVQMPNMDGMDATRAIRTTERETGGRTPIVALTAHTGAAERERCLEAGMDAFIPKPFVAIDLLRRLRGHLKATPGVEADARPAPLLRPSAGADPVFDRMLALQLCGGDTNLLHQVARLYLRGCPTSMERIRAAVTTRNSVELAAAAHGLKGTAHSVGGRAASGAALELEKLGKSGDLAGAEAALAKLEAEVDRLAPVLEKL